MNSNPTKRGSIQISLNREDTTWLEDVLAKAYPGAINMTDNSKVTLLLFCAAEILVSKKLRHLDGQIEKIGANLPVKENAESPKTYSERYRSVSVSQEGLSWIIQVVNKAFPTYKDMADRAKVLLLLRYGADVIMQHDLRDMPFPERASVRMTVRG